MRLLIIFIITAINSMSWAVPVVNENVANSGVMTIYPDNMDPHRYYVAPNVVQISTNKEGQPNFVYAEYKQGLFDQIGVMQMTLEPAYTNDELSVAQAEIRKKDPLAEFSGVPFIGSRLELTGALADLFKATACDHPAGLIGQEQACSLILSRKGRKIFYKALESKVIFTTLQFQYSLQAVVRKADGKYADQVVQHGVAAVIHGGQLSRYPGLIRRK